MPGDMPQSRTFDFEYARSTFTCSIARPVKKHAAPHT